MPQMTNAHIDRYLTNLSLQYKNAAMVNEQLAPPVMVQKESDLIPTYPIEMMFQVFDSVRGLKSRAQEVDFDYGTPLRYSTQQHSLKAIVPDRLVRNADTPLQPRIETMEYLQNSLDLEKEKAVAIMATTASNFPTANVTSLSGTSQWSDYTDGVSHPYLNIKAGKQAVWNAVRHEPNTIIFPWEVAETLGQHPDTIERTKYTHADLLTADGLPKTILGMQVVTAGAGYDTANAGQAPSISGAWGKNVVIAYVERAPKLRSISFMKTFRVEKYVRRWRDEEREGDILEVNDIYDVMQIAGGCGYLIQNVIA